MYLAHKENEKKQELTVHLLEADSMHRVKEKR
jgi:hypothetical protein